MTKYIPIDALYSALNFIEQNAVKGEEKNVKCITKAIRSIKFVPEDVVKVVRCKDCKYMDLVYPYCNLIQDVTDDNDYCSKGEKDE